MYLYKSSFGMLLSLAAGFVLTGILMAGSFLICLKLELSIYWVVGVYSFIILMLIWKAIYQSSNASIREQDSKLYHHNGFRLKCLGDIGSIRVTQVDPLGLIYQVEGSESSIICMKGDYKELPMKFSLN